MHEEPRQRRRRIPVVDDNHDGAMMLSNLLELNGYQTNTAQEASPEMLEGWISSVGRVPRQRTTKYDAMRLSDSAKCIFGAAPVIAIVNLPAKPRVARHETARALAQSR